MSADLRQLTPPLAGTVKNQQLFNQMYKEVKSSGSEISDILQMGCILQKIMCSLGSCQSGTKGFKSSVLSFD